MPRIDWASLPLVVLLVLFVARGSMQGGWRFVLAVCGGGLLLGIALRWRGDGAKESGRADLGTEWMIWIHRQSTAVQVVVGAMVFGGGFGFLMFWRAGLEAALWFGGLAALLAVCMSLLRLGGRRFWRWWIRADQGGPAS